MKNVIFRILPSGAVTLSLLGLPIILSIYFIISRYSELFVTEQEITYFDVQNNWLGLIFLDQKWVELFNRLMDFAFWGVLAAIVLVGAWLFSAAKVAIENHYASEEFVNFRDSKESWHTHFFVTGFLKVMLVFIIIFAVFSLIGQRIPALATEVSRLTTTTTTFQWNTLWPVVYSGLYIVLLQYIIVVCINLFRTLRAD